MHKTGPFTNSGVSKFVKLVVVYTKLMFSIAPPRMRMRLVRETRSIYMSFNSFEQVLPTGDLGAPPSVQAPRAINICIDPWALELGFIWVHTSWIHELYRDLES